MYYRSLDLLQMTAPCMMIEVAAMDASIWPNRIP